jgi:hypothetical protein
MIRVLALWMDATTAVRGSMVVAMLGSRAAGQDVRRVSG